MHVYIYIYIHTYNCIQTYTHTYMIIIIIITIIIMIIMILFASELSGRSGATTTGSSSPYWSEEQERHFRQKVSATFLEAGDANIM